MKETEKKTEKIEKPEKIEKIEKTEKTKETEKTEKKTEQLIRRYAMLRPGDRVLAAVSGGADSMCMLHLLLALGRQTGFTVAAAHFEHGIRGEESLRDCAFVESACAKAGVEILTEHGDVPSFAAAHGLGLEEAARKLRYEFLARAAETLHCSRIATAHNLDDNAETVLFHLARGTGTTGLTGIPPVRGNIIRPLLALSRQEIEQYLREKGIPHVEDSTNASDDYVRNRIRHTVLPELRDILPAASAAVFRASELLREDDACLNAMARDFTDRFGRDGIPADRLRALSPAVSSRVIRQLWPVSLSMEHVGAVLELLGATERKHLDLPGGAVEIDRGKLFFIMHRPSSEDACTARTRVQSAADFPISGSPIFNSDVSSVPAACEKTAESAETASGQDVVLTPGSAVFLPDRKIRITCEECVAGEDVHHLLNTFLLKCGEIYGTLRCTRRRPGDSLRVRGRGCTKTLKSLFLEANLTQRERDELLVFRDDRGVVAVEGLAEAERTAAQPGEAALRITVERIL